MQCPLPSQVCGPVVANNHTTLGGVYAGGYRVRTQGMTSAARAAVGEAIVRGKFAGKLRVLRDIRVSFCLRE